LTDVEVQGERTEGRDRWTRFQMSLE